MLKSMRGLYWSSDEHELQDDDPDSAPDHPAAPRAHHGGGSGDGLPDEPHRPATGAESSLR